MSDAPLKREVAHQWEKSSAVAADSSNPAVEWPPLLNAQQMHQASEQVLKWTVGTMQRVDDLLGNVNNMGNYASMLGLAGEKLLQYEHQHAFLPEDRQNLKHRFSQLRWRVQIAQQTMQYRLDEHISKVEAVIAACEEHDADGLRVIFADDEPAEA